MLITHEITFDFQNRGFMPWVQVVQDDIYSRAVRISLHDGGKAYAVPTGVSAAVRYRKPDGTVGLYDTLPNNENACVIEDNVITVKLAPQMLTVAGEVLTDVVLTSGQTALATFAFVTNVNRSPVGKLESYNYFNLATVNMAYEELYNAMDAARAEAVQAVPAAVDAWLQAHPEATTTVQDGSISEEKLTAELREKLGGGSGLSPLLVSQLKAFFRDMQILLPQLVYTQTEHAGNAVMEDAAWVNRALEALDDGQVNPPAGGDDTHDHSYAVSVTREATCTEPGLRKYTCSCGHSYTESIPATGHNYADGVCSVCGAADPDAEGGGEVISYTIYNQLTNCTSSNPATSADTSTPFITTVTTVDGYWLKKIAIYAGADIASTNTNITAECATPVIPEGSEAYHQPYYHLAGTVGLTGVVMACKAGETFRWNGNLTTITAYAKAFMLSALPASTTDASVTLGDGLTANDDGSFTATADGAIFFVNAAFVDESLLSQVNDSWYIYKGFDYITSWNITIVDVPKGTGVVRLMISGTAIS